MEATEKSPFERMRQLTAKVVSVPKEEIEKREQNWRKERGKEKSKK